MKKIALLFSAALLMLAASCTNQEIVSDEAQPIKLNITVAGLGGPDTKVAKTDWAVGDKLNCWFDDNNVNHTDPDLVITKTSDGWEAEGLRAGVTLKESGCFSVVYESTNNLSGYTTSYDYESGKFFYLPQTATYSGTSSIEEGVPSYCRPLITLANNIGYTFASNTLTATISDWTVNSTFKVLIKNVPTGYSAKDYMLKTFNITTGRNWPAEARSGFSLRNNSSVPQADGNGNANNRGLTGGVQESDGIAFYYSYFWAYDYAHDTTPSNCDITFTLYEGNSSVKKYTVTGKTVENAENKKCIGVSIDYTKFN